MYVFLLLQPQPPCEDSLHEACTQCQDALHGRKDGRYNCRGVLGRLDFLVRTNFFFFRCVSPLDLLINVHPRKAPGAGEGEASFSLVFSASPSCPSPRDLIDSSACLGRCPFVSRAFSVRDLLGSCSLERSLELASTAATTPRVPM